MKQTTATLKFEYIDGDEQYLQDKNTLITILSQGELRAFNILQILFEIEARKISSPESIIVFDDIADSFDYRNKHAIIEYIKDLNNSKTLKIFILTHNFDFYRNISGRLNLDRNKNIFMAIKSASEIIELKKGQYLKNIFSHYVEHAYDEKIFISLIPFIRNLVEYIYSENSDEYQKLTQCLHIKSETSNLSAHDVQKIFKGKIDFIKTSIDFSTISFKDKNIKDFIYQTANKIQSESTIDPILLENKIVLSIAIRLKTEEYLIKKTSYNSVTDPIDSNQTIELIKRYKAKFSASTNMQLIERVNMITPENIHLNSFMYEPLIDMSIDHLLKLYKSVSDLK